MYPCLNSIGFATDQASSAVFTDASVQNYHAPSSTVFGCEIGDGYDIFEAGGESVSVNGDEIQVGKGGLFYADPSYGSVPMLRKELNAESELDTTVFTPESVSVFQAAKSGAEETYANPDALQSEVDRAAQTLRDAINALKSVSATRTEPAVQGGLRQTAGSGNAKTGETGSILFALIPLTGAGLLFSRKKK